MNAVLDRLLTTQHITIDPLQREWGNVGLRHLDEAGFGGPEPRLRLSRRRSVPSSLMTPDSALNLTAHDLVAFSKTADDVLGDGSANTRRWDQHVDF